MGVSGNQAQGEYPLCRFVSNKIMGFVYLLVLSCFNDAGLLGGGVDRANIPAHLLIGCLRTTPHFVPLQQT